MNDERRLDRALRMLVTYCIHNDTTGTDNEVLRDMMIDLAYYMAHINKRRK